MSRRSSLLLALGSARDATWRAYWEAERDDADIDALIEAADNAAASLETMLAHFGRLTPAGDNAARERILSEVRAALARVQGRDA